MLRYLTRLWLPRKEDLLPKSFVRFADLFIWEKEFLFTAARAEPKAKAGSHEFNLDLPHT